jgi:flavin reductase (NADH)
MTELLHPSDFREAMSLLSAAVNVVTTDGAHGRYGLTASAVCSVTDAPPTVLVCVNRKSAAHAALVGNGCACINILPGDREDIAKEFAGLTSLPHERRFANGIWEKSPAGLPVLRNALASLEGEIREGKPVGSHTVLFIEVRSLRMRADGDGLAYFSRAFHRIERSVLASNASC